MVYTYNKQRGVITNRTLQIDLMVTVKVSPAEWRLIEELRKLGTHYQALVYGQDGSPRRIENIKQSIEL